MIKGNHEKQNYLGVPRIAFTVPPRIAEIAPVSKY
jgi:hypothetical protein